MICTSIQTIEICVLQQTPLTTSSCRPVFQAQNLTLSLGCEGMCVFFWLERDTMWWGWANLMHRWITLCIEVHPRTFGFAYLLILSEFRKFNRHFFCLIMLFWIFVIRHICMLFLFLNRKLIMTYSVSLVSALWFCSAYFHFSCIIWGIFHIVVT